METQVQWSRRERLESNPAIGLYEIANKDFYEFNNFTIGGSRKRLLTLGRASLCDIRLTDPTVSRVHLHIERQDGDAFVLQDAASTNGLFVNDIKVERVVLSPGMWIFVGEAELTVIGLDRKVRIQATTNSSFMMAAIRIYGSIRRAAMYINKSRSSITRTRNRRKMRHAEESSPDGEI